MYTFFKVCNIAQIYLQIFVHSDEIFVRVHKNFLKNLCNITNINILFMKILQKIYILGKFCSWKLTKNSQKNIDLFIFERIFGACWKISAVHAPPNMNKSILFCKYFINKCKYFMNKCKYFMNKCKYFMNGLPQRIYEQIVNFIWTGKKSPRIFVQGDEWTFYYLVVK